MGRRKEYFLIARNKQNNDYQIIKINGKRSLRLEEIDEFTLRFGNSSNMIDYLTKAKVLEFSDCDFYIANQTKQEMNYLEVVYDSRESRTELLREVIDASKQGSLDTNNDIAKRILDNFANKVSGDPVFSDYIINGKSKLPKTFVDNFVGYNKANYSSKYKRSPWAIRTYSILRNVIVEMNRYDATNRESYYSDSRSRDNETARRRLDDKLLVVTDKNYVDGQLTSFDLEDEQSLEDRLIEILDTFLGTPADVIVKNKKGELCYRRRKFPAYEDGDLNKLSTLLTKELAEIIFDLVSTRQTASIFDDGTYEEYMKSAKLRLVSKLKEDKVVLNNAYRWCLVYNKYSDRFKGDNYGRRQYTKPTSE